MSSKGIRILDKKNRIVSVELPDILMEIHDGNLFYWSILYLYATGNLGEGKSITDLEQQILDSDKGLVISWEEINNLSHKFYDLMDLTLIGSKDNKFLHRYKNYQEMYETCDFVIEMVDSSCWEVFSKDQELINSLAAKFQDIKFLDPDFRKQYEGHNSI